MLFEIPTQDEVERLAVLLAAEHQHETSDLLDAWTLYERVATHLVEEYVEKYRDLLAQTGLRTLAIMTLDGLAFAAVGEVNSELGWAFLNYTGTEEP